MDKHEDESQWWFRWLNDSILPWARGDLETLMYCESIGPCVPTTADSRQAVLAFREKVKHVYHDVAWCLQGKRNYGMILDIGCGPLVPAAFLNGVAFGVDPNLPSYREIGYPVQSYGAVLVPFAAENLWMLPDHFFDTILSNNALNHVDDFEATVAEMERLAKPNAFWRLETEYREPTLAEPHLLNDERVLAAFKTFVPKRLRERHWEGITASVLWGTP